LIHSNKYAAILRRTTDVPNTRDVVLTSNPTDAGADNNIAAASGDRRTSIDAQGSVLEARGVALEGTKTNSRVELAVRKGASHVAKERAITDGGIVVATGVVVQSINTNGCVGVVRIFI